MKKINFKEFQIQENLFSDTKTLVDLREGFGNTIYKNSNGIQGLDLALKIYKSDGEIEFNDDELKIIKSISEICIAPIVKAIRDILEDEENKEDNKQ